MKTKLAHIERTVLAATVALVCGFSPVQAADEAITPEAAHAIAVDAYLYFYPLVTIDITRKQSENIETPGTDKEANWLPAPKGAFNLCMRLYGPKSEALTGKWNPPAVMKAQVLP